MNHRKLGRLTLASSGVTLTSALTGREYVFARVGVKAVGFTPLIYGPVVKITL